MIPLNGKLIIPPKASFGIYMLWKPGDGDRLRDKIVIMEVRRWLNTDPEPMQEAGFMPLMTKLNDKQKEKGRQNRQLQINAEIWPEIIKAAADLLNENAGASPTPAPETRPYIEQATKTQEQEEIDDYLRESSEFKPPAPKKAKVAKDEEGPPF